MGRRYGPRRLAALREAAQTPAAAAAGAAVRSSDACRSHLRPRQAQAGCWPRSRRGLCSSGPRLGYPRGGGCGRVVARRPAHGPVALAGRLAAAPAALAGLAVVAGGPRVAAYPRRPPAAAAPPERPPPYGRWPSPPPRTGIGRGPADHARVRAVRGPGDRSGTWCVGMPVTSTAPVHVQGHRPVPWSWPGPSTRSASAGPAGWRRCGGRLGGSSRGRGGRDRRRDRRLTRNAGCRGAARRHLGRMSMDALFAGVLAVATLASARGIRQVRGARRRGPGRCSAWRCCEPTAPVPFVAVVAVVILVPLRPIVGDGCWPAGAGLLAPVAVAATVGFWWPAEVMATGSRYWAGVRRYPLHDPVVGIGALALAVGPAVAVGNAPSSGLRRRPSFRRRPGGGGRRRHHAAVARRGRADLVAVRAVAGPRRASVIGARCWRCGCPRRSCCRPPWLRHGESDRHRRGGLHRLPHRRPARGGHYEVVVLDSLVAHDGRRPLGQRRGQVRCR